MGFLLVNNLKNRIFCWVFSGSTVLIGHLLLLDYAPFVRMIVLVIALLMSMKAMVTHYLNITVSFIRWFVFCFITVGTDVRVFQRKRNTPVRFDLIRNSVFNILIGGLLMTLAIALHNSNKNDIFWIKSFLALFGVSFIFHFGILSLNTLLLQRLGFQDYPIFNQPFRSKSLREFWGKRWNTAFSQMTKICVFMPLSRRMNSKVAYMSGFFFSGLLHEIAISLSVQKGYGLPLIFFLINAIGIEMEKKYFLNKQPGLIWVIVFLILPFPLLFHAPFINGIIWSPIDLLLVFVI